SHPFPLGYISCFAIERCQLGPTYPPLCFGPPSSQPELPFSATGTFSRSIRFGPLAPTPTDPGFRNRTTLRPRCEVDTAPSRCRSSTRLDRMNRISSPLSLRVNDPVHGGRVV